MLKIYCGDRHTIREKIKSDYKYTENIIESLKPQKRLFGDIPRRAFWFDYDNKLLKTKDDINNFINLCDKYDVVCVLESVDKRSIFYKTFSKQIQFINEQKQQEFTIKDVLDISDKDFVSYLYKWYYSNKKYRQEIAKTINSILTGKLKIYNAKQYLYLLTN